MTRKPGMWNCVPPSWKSSAPPTDQSTKMNVTAERNAARMPATMSTGASVA